MCVCVIVADVHTHVHTYIHTQDIPSHHKQIFSFFLHAMKTRIHAHTLTYTYTHTQDIPSHHKQIFSFLLDVLETRTNVIVAEVLSQPPPSLVDFRAVEDAALAALEALVLKLNETRYGL